MKFLADANVLSEPTRPNPWASVVEWLRANESELVIDPIVLGEIRFGIHLVPSGKRRRGLERWFENGVEKVQCLPWDSATGLRWAKLLADLRGAGREMSIKDSMIAATALRHGLKVATRNERDFRKADVAVINPFEEE